MNRNLFKLFAPLIFISIIGCFYVVVSKSIFLADFFFGIQPENHGQLDTASKFGDSAGFINALFSALAFGGVLLTFYWQFMVDGKQHKAALQSQFENVFFNMTSTLENIIKELVVDDSDVEDFGTELREKYTKTSNPVQRTENSIKKGREVFAFWFSVFSSKSEIGNSATENIYIFKELMKGSLDHYFRYLYRILVFIDQSTLLTDEEKYEYAAILRAQLSEYELLILFFNGLSAHGKQKAKPLFEKYSMFNNLRESELERFGSINAYKQTEEEDSSESKYAPSAFNHEYSHNLNIIYSSIQLVFTSIALIVMYNLIKPYWDEYVINMILSRLPDNNKFIECLCILMTAYVYINLYFEKKSLFINTMQKKYGNSVTDETLRYLPLGASLNRSYNIASIPILILLVYALFCNYDWYGFHIPYAFILAPCLIADIIMSLPYIRPVRLNREECLNNIANILVPLSTQLKFWWRGVRRRYKRNRIQNHETSATTSAAVPQYSQEVGADEEENSEVIEVYAEVEPAEDIEE